jgi:ribosomal protein L34
MILHLKKKIESGFRSRNNNNNGGDDVCLLFV